MCEATLPCVTNGKEQMMCDVKFLELILKLLDVISEVLHVKLKCTIRIFSMGFLEL